MGEACPKCNSARSSLPCAYPGECGLNVDRLRAELEKSQARVLELEEEGRVIPEGYQLVPVEPTASMLNAAIDAHGLRLGDISPLGFRMSPQKMFSASYKAMLAVANSEKEGGS